MKQIIQQGATSVRQRIFVPNSSTGAGLTGLTNATSGLTMYYFRDGDTSTTVQALSAGTLGTYSAGGFVAVDATHMPGVYEIGIPNAAFSNTVRDCIVVLQGAASMNPVCLEFQLVPWNPQDGVRLGLTALPNVAAGAAGGLPTATNASGQVTASGVSGNVTGSVASVTGSVASVTGNVGGSVASVTAGVTVSTNNDKTGYSLATAPPTASQVAAAILATPANLLATNGSGYVTAASVQGNVTGSVASVTGAVGSVTGAVGSVTGSVGSVASVVEVDMTQAVPTSNTAQTHGDCLNAARAQGFGKWVQSGTSLTLYANDGTTVLRTFTLDSATAPTQRV